MSRRSFLRYAILVIPWLAALLLLPADLQAADRNNFTAHLAGGNEVPPVETEAQGQAIFKLRADGTELHYKLIAANIDDILMAHIHLGAADVNGPVVVWLYPDAPPPQLIPGRFDGVLAEGVITDADVVGMLDMSDTPLADLIDVMRAGGAYVNLHTLAYPPGEIRGQIR